MYELKTTKKFDKIFVKLTKKDPIQANSIIKKIEQILKNPEHFKPLRANMKGVRRVHIDSSFVLIYEIKGRFVILLDYDHHDNIYE